MASSREAFVTLCTTDAYVPGALVVAHSLRMAGTTRKIVCMTVASLPAHSRAQLVTVFDEVIDVKPEDTGDAAALKLLGRPELGVTATKISCWTLTHFTKCVFVDADTLVLTNVDDLFDRPSFAAAPDVGWPDCFNSGVFVFTPSQSTYADLVKTLTEHGSFDGGDQGLLNTYFSSWSTDSPAHRLPFVYNMTQNASYGYAPALSKFKDTVKIVHFIGEAKPWMGASSSPWVDRWTSVYTNLSQHGSLKCEGGACTPPLQGQRTPNELPSPAHWAGSSPPMPRRHGDGNVSPGTFSEIKQMLDAAIAAGDAVPETEDVEEAAEEE